MHKTRPVSSTLEEIEAALKPLIESPGTTAVCLDLDGTLAPIVPRPETVAVPASISRLLRRLMYRFMAVAVVSGRPATEAKRIVGISEIAYIGNHGFEIMIPGHAVVISEETQPFVGKVHELADYCRSLLELAEAGILVEDKMATMSLHYRRANDPEAARKFLVDTILPRIKEAGLVYSEGRMVLEVRPPIDINKGVSVGKLLDRLNATQAVYIGDDTTDIDALKELRRRGKEKNQSMVGIGVISDEMPAGLTEYSDLLVDRNSGVEMVLQMLVGDEI